MPGAEGKPDGGPRRPGGTARTRSGKEPSAGAGEPRPRFVLPGNLPRSLRHLEDGQLEDLLRAATAEARRRGWEAAAAPARQPERGKSSGRLSKAAAGGQAPPVSPGLERVVRAALEAGVKPGAIARQFGLPRPEVQRIAAAMKRKR